MHNEESTNGESSLSSRHSDVLGHANNPIVLGSRSVTVAKEFRV